MFDPNMTLVDGFKATNYGLACMDMLNEEKEVPVERKPLLTRVVTDREGITEYYLYYRGSGLMLVVRVEEASPSISPEKVAAAGGMLPVDPVNLTVRTWRTKDKNELRVSVKADKLVPVTGPAPTPGK